MNEWMNEWMDEHGNDGRIAFGWHRITALLRKIIYIYMYYYDMFYIKQVWWSCIWPKEWKWMNEWMNERRTEHCVNEARTI
jgi:hypothetical protein